MSWPSFTKAGPSFSNASTAPAEAVSHQPRAVPAADHRPPAPQQREQDARRERPADDDAPADLGEPHGRQVGGVDLELGGGRSVGVGATEVGDRLGQRPPLGHGPPLAEVEPGPRFGLLDEPDDPAAVHDGQVAQGVPPHQLSRLHGVRAGGDGDDVHPHALSDAHLGRVGAVDDDAHEVPLRQQADEALVLQHHQGGGATAVHLRRRLGDGRVGSDGGDRGDGAHDASSSMVAGSCSGSRSARWSA